ncbi:phosphoglycerate dehydrogenase-like enzyme [Arthrobacter silviterrae]|uniref:Hydroxyacid dehydrogenase n=1 Tax=Arthrobacter silviterrae TaxID=2026658 RepID=A0ABX0D7D3_9MICC|nr:hydroxyacid dehydrogenase [Arthrobacter silviterrae]MDQ0277010.1 phosphoglycerate dehydrogenase-like enzyme [Arthrobacter silviterrae]NGN82798.1 hydroxyacid dehydrogenase [Arthrobacter silviterrae]
MSAEHARARPQVAFAMKSNELRDRLFDAPAMQRLARVADVVHEDVLTEFESDHARKVLGRTTALITGWGCPVIDDAALAAGPGLELIAHAAGSVKGHVSLECWNRGIRVTTAAQGNAVPVAEYTLAFILLAGKNAVAEHHKQHTHRSTYRKDVLATGYGNASGTVGIIGASRIGRLVIDLLKPFSLDVLLSDPTLTSAEAQELGVELVPLGELMERSRVVSLHAPLLPSTVGMVGAAELARLQDGATFINTARGVLVDHDALRAELLDGRINAVLDVTSPEPLPDGDALYDLPNVILTPHIAGSVGNELTRMGGLAVNEVERLARGERPAYAITEDVLLAMA